MASSREVDTFEAEKEEEKEKTEEGEVLRKEFVEEVQRNHHQSVYDENAERRKREGKQKKCKTP